MSTVDWEALRAAAVEAAGRAYAPYSKFPVGAAGFVDDGRVVVGCNVENACYGVGLCAECGMVSTLLATGGGRLRAVVAVGGHGQLLSPCGRCRQLLLEHGGRDCAVLLESGETTVDGLLPHGFDDADLRAEWEASRRG
ncbi:cytidine deaminase [Motilibacter rhizosphaerae]|uniref:Cytidine deaminase n=1 Tax=Motilibacter rhizosphaerae TaxID=598652 RepID=A0A4Q7NT38_9ACTN|nr:cytidine deaminase [Motilibacter rhizosphaerae]RZS90267.1 cytidine deaminase [Motilibacter rhizosphaerae]